MEDSHDTNTDEQTHGNSNGIANENGTTKKRIDWAKYGLADTSSYQNSKTDVPNEQFLYNTGNKIQVKDLFEHEQEQSGNPHVNDPWWKSTFFITTKLLFGTWDGVFTTCVMNMVGVVIFLRTGWMVGYAGIGLSLLIVLLSFLIALSTVMSAVAICDRCDIGKGGVYFIITHVLGGKIGGTMGLLYCFGHAIATSLYCTGFAESMVELMNWKSSWAIRCVAIITLFVLLGIALSGVKWIIRFQLVLIFILAIAMLDFMIGTLALVKPDDGFTGFTNFNFENNLDNGFDSSVSFFTVFGVFFPTACGVLAGVNMSGDLKEPAKSIPEGSLASIGVCGALYTIIVLFLGSTCSREVLKSDYMIMEKVSLVGGLFVFGLFVASLSSSLGGLVGPPRVIQCIAEEDVLPILAPFSKMTGTNQEPRNATLLVALVSLLFIFVGNLNALAPIVTMPFLTAYTTINYAYFAMAMSFDIKKEIIDSKGDSPQKQVTDKYEDIADSENPAKLDTVTEKNEPEIEDNTANVNKMNKNQYLELDDATDFTDDNVNVLPNTIDKTATSKKVSREISYQHIEWIQKKHHNELYAKLCNRWISLFTAITCLVLSFAINWVYALANLSATLLLYIFISQARPGLPPGVSNDFNLAQWLYSVVSRSNSSKKDDPEHVIVPSCLPYGISMFQVSQDNTDYEHRDKKHHASLVQKNVPFEQ